MTSLGRTASVQANCELTRDSARTVTLWRYNCYQIRNESGSRGIKSTTNTVDFPTSQPALAGEPLDAAAQWQFEGWIKQHLTHAAFMRRLHEAELLSDVEFEIELEDIRTYAENERVREVLERILAHETSFRELILR